MLTDRHFLHVALLKYNVNTLQPVFILPDKTSRFPQTESLVSAELGATGFSILTLHT